jgi:glycine dehydrogenase subunit 2
MNTQSGNRGLVMDEPLLFEQDAPGRCGVDLEAPEGRAPKLGGLERQGAIGLPGLAEPQVVRHFTRLSQKNYAIDAGFYPLGSCTMKHNPRLNEKAVRMPGFALAHPLQPESTVQGALELIATLAHWLTTLTGMPGVAMSPAAGAHGELAGLMTIRAALTARGDARKKVLVPESAHGTNPATATLCDYAVEAIPANPRGRIDIEALKEALDEDVAALMLTNPNTCGLFEDEIVEVARLVHEAGAFFYGDGANFNAIVGRVRPGDLGIDAMHINLHKTFSTPHGGGGPGSGPVVLAESLVPFAPLPYVVVDGDGFRMVEHDPSDRSFGRLRAFHGQMGMFVRALAYMMSHGADGLRQVAEDAVLNANYVMARLKGAFHPPFDGPCMHECLFDDRTLKDTGVSTLDLAKALIDEGFHPMTMYFPLVVHGAMLIEPTETESKATLDQFCDTMLALMEKAQAGNAEWFHEAPHLAPWRRLDETTAARHPVLTWTPEEGRNAAE